MSAKTRKSRQRHRRRRSGEAEDGDVPIPEFANLALDDGKPLQLIPAPIPTPPTSPHSRLTNPEFPVGRRQRDKVVVDGQQTYKPVSPSPSPPAPTRVAPLNDKATTPSRPSLLAKISTSKVEKKTKSLLLEAPLSSSWSQPLTPEAPQRTYHVGFATLEHLRPALPSGSEEVMLTKDNDQRKKLKTMIFGGLTSADFNINGERLIAIDCEMVGVGPVLSYRIRNGFRIAERASSLARISVIGYNGEVLLDSFVIQTQPVTDFRTAFSGIRPQHLSPSRARPYQEVRNEVLELMKGCSVVGHAIHNDLSILRVPYQTRLHTTIHDTQKLPAVVNKHGHNVGLKALCLAEFGVDPQPGAHSSVTDARATMALYRLFECQKVELSTSARTHL